MERKPKILFIYYSISRSSGIARILVSLINLLVDKFDITLLLLTVETEQKYAISEKVTIRRLNSFHTPEFSWVRRNRDKINKIPKINNIFSYIYDLGVHRMLHKWLEENGDEFDIIISPWYKLSISLGINQKLASKTIAWEHISHKSGGILYHKILKKKLYSRLNRVITITDVALPFYNKINRAKKISNFAEPSVFKGDKINFKHRKNQLIIVGRLVEQKNHVELLEIFKEFQTENTDWNLKIVGDGLLRNQVEVKIKDLQLESSVELVGDKTQEEINALLQESKIFVMTSLVEGMPLALIEATSAGLALVSYDTPTGPREIVNSENGKLIDFRNKKQFSDYLKYLAENADVLENKCRGSYETFKRYRPERIVQLWEDEFKHILNA